MDVIKITITKTNANTSANTTKPLSFPIRCQPIKPEMIEPVDKFEKEQDAILNKSDNNSEQRSK